MLALCAVELFGLLRKLPATYGGYIRMTSGAVVLLLVPLAKLLMGRPDSDKIRMSWNVIDIQFQC